MTSYLNINELAASITFRGRVQAALAVKAAAVLTEEDLPTGQAAKRRQLAESTLVDPAPLVNRFIWLVVTNGTIRSKGMDATDQDLEWVIGWAWDQAAGVTETDKQETPA